MVRATVHREVVRPDARRPRIRHIGSAALIGALLAACADEPAPVDTSPYTSEVDEGLGIAVAILIDNSGSMSEPAEGDELPKYVVARRAVGEMLAVTDSFVANNPELPVKVAILRFSGDADVVLPMRAYDRAEVLAAVESIPEPEGATAIGDGMASAREELYRSGVFRKHMIVITDGENTTGRDPGREAREIFARSEGAVRMHFVAFDVAAREFAFVEEVEGGIFEASNAGTLRAGLDQLYRTQILAEAMDEVEPGSKP